jgi:hypothetical protein
MRERLLEAIGSVPSIGYIGIKGFQTPCSLAESLQWCWSQFNQTLSLALYLSCIVESCIMILNSQLHC